MLLAESWSVTAAQLMTRRAADIAMLPPSERPDPELRAGRGRRQGELRPTLARRGPERSRAERSLQRARTGSWLGEVATWGSAPEWMAECVQEL